MFSILLACQYTNVVFLARWLCYSIGKRKLNLPYFGVLGFLEEAAGTDLNNDMRSRVRSYPLLITAQERIGFPYEDIQSPIEHSKGGIILQ